MNLTDYVFERSRDLEKDFVIGQNERVSYRDIFRKIGQVSSLLESYGFGKGEKILLMSDNSVFFIASYFGIIRSGCVCVPVDTRMSEGYLDHICKLCGIRCAFVQEKYLDRIEARNPERIITDGHSLEMKPSGRGFEPSPEDLALILFTSGSTGLPKGVMLTHHNVIHNTESILGYLDLKESDIMEVVLPFFYCYGASLLHTHAKAGASMVLNNKFIFPATVLQNIQKYRCTGLAGVPSTYQILLRRTRIRDADLSSLRYALQAGGRLPNPFIKEVLEAMPHVRFYVMYGQTEATARLSYLPPEEIRERLGSIGKGIPGIKLDVLNEEGSPVKPGEVGEIVAAGGNVMKGYFMNDEETGKVLKNGKLHTGDLATVDGDGYIYIVAREKNIIKSGGNRISPKEIEDVILSLPEIVQAVAIPVDDDELGEAVKVFAVPAGGLGLSPEQVKSFCQKSLPSFKVPKYVEFVSSIPMNSSGKVLIEELKLL